MNTQHKIKEWNLMVREGKGRIVADALNHLPKSELTPGHLAQIGNLAWRVGRPSRGANLLTSEYIRQKDFSAPETPELFAEYGYCLCELGAVTEGRQILHSVENTAPKALFYLALSHFKTWDYAAAIPLLERYVARVRDPYESQVARVNLGAAYAIANDWNRATATLQDVMPAFEKAGHLLLTGNCHEILAQIAFKQDLLVEARAQLSLSEKYLGGTQNAGWLYCKKWQFIVGMAEAAKAGPMDRAKWRQEMSALRKEAIARQSWETVRDMDFFYARYCGDLSRLARVYYGSPFTGYRERMRWFLPKGWEPPDPLVQNAGGKTVYLEELVHPARQKLTPLMKNLLLTLQSDAYSPFRSGQLFGKIFPGEHFNVKVSPHRIFRLVLAARKVLKEISPGSAIACTHFGYRLRFDRTEQWITPRFLAELPAFDDLSLTHAFLRRYFGPRTFSAVQLAEYLSTSKRTAQRTLSDLEQIQAVRASGSGRSTKFKAS